MAHFVRCRGKAYCIDGERGCRSCGRSTSEIAAARSLIAQAAQFILDQDYDNAGEFTSYLAEKIAAKVRHARHQDPRTGTD